MAAVAYGSKTEPPLSGTSTSRTLKTPASTIAGQLVVAVIKINGAAVTVAAAGYTVKQVHVGGAEEHTLATLYRVATEAGEKSIEITWGGASRYNAGLTFRVTGINPALNPPVEVAVSKANETASKSLTFPSATAGRKEMLSVLVGGENIEGEAGSTPPSGWTSRQSFSGGGAPFVATKSLSSTGATGEVVATLSTARATTAIHLLVAGEEEETPPEVPLTKLGTVAAGVAETDTVALTTTSAVETGETVILAYTSNGNWGVKSVTDPEGLVWGKDEEVAGSSPHFGVVSIWSAKAPAGLPSGSTITLKLFNSENSGKAAMAVSASNVSPVLPWLDRASAQKGTGTGWATGLTKESTRAKTVAIAASMTRTTNSIGRSFTTAPALEVYDFRSANFLTTMSCLTLTKKGKAEVAGIWWPESFDYVSALALYRVVEEPEPPPPPEPEIPRLYSAASPLNSPIPAAPRIHPDSDAIIAYLVENEIDRKFSFTAGYNAHTDYNHPIYFAEESDPKYPCLFSDTFGDQTFGGYEVHVPTGALPAAGSDGHMGIIQPDGMEVDFLNFEGVKEGHIHAHWGGKTLFTGPGINVGPNGGGVAARYALGFGAVTAKELEEEAPMKQALFAVVPGTNGKFVSPAYGPAGSGGPSSLACGLRLFLDYTEEEIERLPAVGWQKAIIRRLKRYGALVGDTGGDFIKCEADAPYQAKSEESPLVKLAKALGIPEQVGEGEIYKGTWKYRLDGIVDWSRLKVLSPLSSLGLGRIRVIERPPMRQYLLATTPGGKLTRWGEDEPGADRVFEDLSSSDSVPGGCKELACAFARKPGVEYGDMDLGTKIEEFGAGGYKIWEGTLQDAPRTSGDKLVMDPAAVGYQDHLTDDESAQCIPIDADISAWGSASAAQIAKETKQTISSGEVLPAGSPQGSMVASLSHSFSQLNNVLGENLDLVESYYDGGGVELGKIILDFAAMAGMGGGWAQRVDALLDNIYEGAYETLENFESKSATQVELAVAAQRFFIALLTYNGSEAFTGAGKWEVQYRNTRIQDRSGIPLYGVWPNVGVLASDVIAYALGRWAPLINFTIGANGTIRPTRFPIPHLPFKEPTTVQEIISQSTRFELPEWAVWPGQDGPTFYLNPRGQREGRKRWRIRAAQAQLKATGPSMSRVVNGVLVQYQDVDGSTRVIAPTGSGYRLTSDRLLDTDPLNPANRAGKRKWKKIAMKSKGTNLGAEETGERYIEQMKLLDGSGEATLTGYVEDEHGAMWPYYCVRSGDVVDPIDSSISGDRYIISANRSRPSRSSTVVLDAPPDSYEAALERLDVEELGIG